MKLIFVCPETNRTFESAAYTICENKGIATDAAGNKFLDARLALDAPCPHCGKPHVFHASELACPFGTDPGA